MAHKAVTIDLVRDGQCTPWGFRMSGGADIGTPLLIQRVTMGSPSEGELHKGDIILAINDIDARKVSHQRATDIIAKAGNHLRLTLARNYGPAPPMSPTPGTPTTIYHMKSNPGIAPTSIAPFLSGSSNPALFKPLPKTEFKFHNDNDRTLSKYDVLCNDNSAANEKVVIANQAYRTLPLITPTLKSTKDYPVGSYLRHNPDTSGRTKLTNNLGNRIADAYMLSKVQEAVLEKALSSPRASVSSSRTPTPDSGYQSIYLRQYNSPINMYSTQTILETLNAQTGAHKHVPPCVKPPTVEAIHEVLLATSYRSNSPRPQTPTKGLPGIPDVVKSPTYQLIHEEEWKDLQKQKLAEHKPIQNKLYYVEGAPKSGLESYDIQQSSSFKTLMHNVRKEGVTNI